MRKIISNIPNALTCLNLLSGCVAVIMAFYFDDRVGGLTGQQWCYICIGAAAIFDFCDGMSARMLRAYSALGKELDSLSDLVSFGVAPGMLVFNIMAAHSTHPVACAVALMIPLLGAIRLAKFNVDETQTTSFRGLPIPANAIFWIGCADWIAKYEYPGYVVMVVLVALFSLAMVSNIRMFSLKFKSLDFYSNVKRYAIILAAIAFVALNGISGLAWTIILYILLSIFSKEHD